MFKINSVKNKYVDKITSVSCPEFVEISQTEPNKSPLGPNWKSKPCVLIKKYYDDYAEAVKNFEVREDDVWIVSYPKCGSTWTQEMVWLILNDLDYKTAKSTLLTTRCPFIELGGIQVTVPLDTLSKANDLPSPRLIKSHLPMSLLPDQLWTKKPKIVYVVRNPKDVAVSWFHHYSMIMGYRGTLEDFLEGFMSDSIVYSPFFDHFLEFWHMRNEENILFTTYEDMKNDTKGGLKKIAKFLNKSYIEEEFDVLTDHVSFDSMKKNPATNGKQDVPIFSSANGRKDVQFEFMRKGEIGSYKAELSEEYINRLDAWTADCLKSTDFKFNFGN